MGEEFDKFCSFINLYNAYRQARKGKRGKASVAAFEFNQEEELIKLRDELRGGEWKPGAYSNFYIHEPKKRMISAAPFRDRVVHHALCNILEPDWERRFIFDTYANRKFKGTHQALLRANEYAKKFRYVLQCDVEQFFPSIDHEILFGKISAHLEDEALLGIVKLILESGVGAQTETYEMKWFEGDDLFAPARPRGLPIGNLTSQFWGNVYLSSFDHFAKRELRAEGYIRYVDDFLLFSNDKMVLREWKEKVIIRMSKLRLTLHEPQIFPVETGIPFLGFRVYPTHRRLKKKRGIAFQRRFRRLHQQWRMREIERRRLDDSARSWAAHAAWGDTYGLRRSVLGRFLL
ncbi:MAG: RNA-dependent DNA polymerase [Chloroflexi bacterium]|nr:RNA-dependent DNA polymerase [Chloroflexi bacterium CFX1]MCK6566484.1 RNA-directed DNA polymerase [Anaerolineales bacterium]MCQ3952020.1 RNA-dependent DNA polymerase [Chloroflexota bacterium]MDL1918119.1 RNA-dependent DNA polymerase [Chloroflexi bacterium CFX5]NUQ59091.1 RNA-dependent DNA polymerase [Anaerolineales bacterium]